MNHNMNHNMNMNMNNNTATNTTDPCSDSMMMMYFHTGYCEFVLFKELRTTSAAEMVAACVAVFFLSCLYEGVKAYREYLLQHPLARSSSDKYDTDTKVKTPRKRMLNCVHFLQTFLHLIQVFISYCVMMVFMTFNVWLCMSVVLGASVGFFLFGWTRVTLADSDHCHN